MLSSTLTAVVMDSTLLILGLDVLLHGYGGTHLWFNNVPVDYTQIKTQLQVNAIVLEHCQELSLMDTGVSNTIISASQREHPG